MKTDPPGSGVRRRSRRTSPPLGYASLRASLAGSGVRRRSRRTSAPLGYASLRASLAGSGVRRRSRRTSEAFTLLEVLAAVAILALWFTVLAGAAIQGLRAEGESERRLRASLLADELLADFDAQQSLGVAPPLQNEQFERDEYQVRIDVEPFDLAFRVDPEAPNAAAPRPARGNRTTPPPTLLAGAGPNAPSPLRSIRIEVRWSEGVGERSVLRSSYAFDLVAAQPTLQVLLETEEPVQ